MSVSEDILNHKFTEVTFREGRDVDEVRALLAEAASSIALFENGRSPDVADLPIDPDQIRERVARLNPVMFKRSYDSDEVSDYLENVAVELETYIAEVHRRIEEEKARIEQERIERELAVKLEQERIEAERLEVERLEAERIEAERLEAERVEQERLATERAEQERVEAEERRVEEERLRAEQERVEAERAESQRLEEERREAEKIEEALREKERAALVNEEIKRIEEEQVLLVPVVEDNTSSEESSPSDEGEEGESFTDEEQEELERLEVERVHAVHRESFAPEHDEQLAEVIDAVEQEERIEQFESEGGAVLDENDYSDIIVINPAEAPVPDFEGVRGISLAALLESAEDVRSGSPLSVLYRVVVDTPAGRRGIDGLAGADSEVRLVVVGDGLSLVEFIASTRYVLGRRGDVETFALFDGVEAPVVGAEVDVDNKQFVVYTA